jgi:hypothetical protein
MPARDAPFRSMEVAAECRRRRPAAAIAAIGKRFSDSSRGSLLWKFQRRWESRRLAFHIRARQVVQQQIECGIEQVFPALL